MRLTDDITPEQERETECCDLAAKVPCADCPQAAVSKICLTKFEEILLRAAQASLNYIANTEAELGITLESGDLLRDAIGKIESYIDGGRALARAAALSARVKELETELSDCRCLVSTFANDTQDEKSGRLRAEQERDEAYERLKSKS